MDRTLYFHSNVYIIEGLLRTKEIHFNKIKDLYLYLFNPILLELMTLL